MHRTKLPAVRRTEIVLVFGDSDGSESGAFGCTSCVGSASLVLGGLCPVDSTQRKSQCRVALRCVVYLEFRAWLIALTGIANQL